MNHPQQLGIEATLPKITLEDSDKAQMKFFRLNVAGTIGSGILTCKADVSGLWKCLKGGCMILRVLQSGVNSLFSCLIAQGTWVWGTSILERPWS